MHKFQTVICGGTFDLLHIGHREFLRQVFEKGERVVIGLTSDNYVSKYKLNRNVASFEIRKNDLEKFFKQTGVGKRVKIIPIDEFYGPLLDPNFHADALAVSEHRENAMKINKKRKSLGMKELQIIELELKRGEDGRIVSSSIIRNGEIDREGYLYVKPSWERKDLLLPSTLRHLLQDTLGEVITEVPLNIDLHKTITVGDVTTAKFRNLKMHPKLSIVDFRVNRKDIAKSDFKDSNVIRVKNPAGTISWKLFKEIQKQVQSKKDAVIIVDGEEDLSVLPSLLCAPLGFQIFYGQPIRLASLTHSRFGGMVKVGVTEENKKKTKNLVDRFEIV